MSGSGFEFIFREQVLSISGLKYKRMGSMLVQVANYHTPTVCKRSLPHEMQSTLYLECSPVLFSESVCWALLRQAIILLSIFLYLRSLVDEWNSEIDDVLIMQDVVHIWTCCAWGSENHSGANGWYCLGFVSRNCMPRLHSYEGVLLFILNKSKTSFLSGAHSISIN